MKTIFVTHNLLRIIEDTEVKPEASDKSLDKKGHLTNVYFVLDGIFTT